MYFLSRLGAKNLSNSTVRRNSFSQLGVKPCLPLGSLACARASFALSLIKGALASIATGDGLSSIATGFASPRRKICLMTSAPTTIRDSGTSMKWLCITCNNKKRCEHELAKGTATEHFHEFCPNAVSIDELLNQKG